ncbi:MAG: hypothetical protein RL456_2383 [Pseudomonadota bacterium]|jgi:uncharacterized membrane-anchored protein
MSPPTRPKTQQAFLLEAMQRMGLDADGFARRIGAPRRRLDDWLRSPGDPAYVELDPVIWAFVREITGRLDERESGPAPLDEAAPIAAVMPRADAPAQWAS